MPFILLILYLTAALTLQLVTGDFPQHFFAFPLNLIMAVLWLLIISIVWKYRKNNRIASFFLSRGATFSAIIPFLVFCIVVGFTGMRYLVRTWVFVAFMLYFQTVLLFVTLRGWRKLRFLLNHAGLLLAISSAFWGAPDTEEMRLRAFRDIPTREAYRIDGTSAWLQYDILLKDFNVETYENGVPSMYEAALEIDGKPVILKVNHPYSPSFGEDVYLTGYDAMAGRNSEYCIIQIVREPWKYGAAAGIAMMLAGALLMFAAGPKKRNAREA